MGANDLASDAMDLSLAELETYDKQLELLGAYTLTEVMMHNDSLTKKLLKRKKINTELEYYCLRNFLEENSEDLSVYQIDNIEKLLDSFVGRSVSKQSREIQ